MTFPFRGEARTMYLFVYQPNRQVHPQNLHTKMNTSWTQREGGVRMTGYSQIHKARLPGVIQKSMQIQTEPQSP